MQTKKLTALLTAGLAVLALWSNEASAQNRKQSRPRDPSKPVAGADHRWESDVKGEGDSPELADQVAVVLARNKLLEHLGRQPYLPENTVLDEFIQSTLVKKKIAHSPDQEGDPVAHGSFTTDLHLVLDGPGFRELRKLARQKAEADRQDEVGRRMFFLGRGLIGLVVLLGGFAGYLRMEDMTRGAHTTLLRLGAIGLVSAVVAGLWLIF
jgi:hypothetical protein